MCKLVLRMYWDGETEPSVEVPLGEFFGIGFGMRRNYCCAVLCMNPDNGRGKNSMYRYHVHDPISFEKSLTFSIEHGHANKLSNDYSSTAYWYQTEPHAPFPAMLPVGERLPRVHPYEEEG